MVSDSKVCWGWATWGAYEVTCRHTGVRAPPPPTPPPASIRVKASKLNSIHAVGTGGRGQNYIQSNFRWEFCDSILSAPKSSVELIGNAWVLFNSARILALIENRSYFNYGCAQPLYEIKNIFKMQQPMTMGHCRRDWKLTVKEQLFYCVHIRYTAEECDERKQKSLLPYCG